MIVCPLLWLWVLSWLWSHSLSQFITVYHGRSWFIMLCHAISCFTMLYHAWSWFIMVHLAIFSFLKSSAYVYIYNYTILYVYTSRDMTWLSFDPCLRQVILSWIFLSHLLKKTATPAEASGTPVIPRSAGSRQPEMEHTGCTVIRALATNNHW